MTTTNGNGHVAATTNGHIRPVVTVGVRAGDEANRRAQKTAERVAADIVRDLVAEGLRTGDHLPLEAAMVERYHASRASVREALRLLEVQGLIHLKPGPGGGPVVGQVDPANLARTSTLYFHLSGATYEAVLRAQVALEPICAQLAARHPNRQDAMQRFLVPAGLRTTSEYRRHTEDFHATVYRLAGNPIMSLLTQAVTRIITDHVVATMDPVELRGAILHEHAALARAIAAGQPEVAGRLMAEHLAAQHDYYRRNAPERLTELVEWR
ncbi:MAG TPA: FCD domain-containing protein [Acidimicrobiales bacterium]|jgi:DNA-binding FadR family transcriptional regulator